MNRQTISTQVILDLRDLPRFEAEGQSEAVNAFKRRPANVGNEAYDDCPENLKGVTRSMLYKFI